MFINRVDAAISTNSTLVELSAGKYIQGVNVNSKVQKFLGIRYAKAPIGSLRFKSTVSPEPSWTGTYNATNYGSSCPQYQDNNKDGVNETYIGKEDCLFLNIWRPTSAKPNSKLPVFFWVHGGAYVAGSGSNAAYEASEMAEKSNIIVVTINYRLGRLGFLSAPVLTKNNSGQVSGNFGLTDQIAALKWVKNNISYFGGDSNNITLAGESAGGFSVCYLLSSPLANGLFTKAIIQSGICPSRTINEATKVGMEFIQESSCNYNDENDIYKCLMNSKAEELIKDDPGVNFKQEYLLSQTNLPVVDGFVMKQAPLITFQKGEQNKVPIIIGHNSGEGLALVSKEQIKYNEQEFFNSLVRNFGKTNGALIYQAYNPKNYESTREAILDFSTDFNFGCEARKIASTLSKTQVDSIFRYLFDVSSLSGWKAILDQKSSTYNPLPTAHAIDIYYVFQHADLLNKNLLDENNSITPSDQRMEQIMLHYWGNFTKTSDPNSLSRSWTQYSTITDSIFLLTPNPSQTTKWHKAQCDLYDTII